MADYKKESLANLLSREKIETTLFLNLAIEICQGLTGWHAAQRVYPDLQPNNILITWDPLSVELRADKGNNPSQSYYYQAPEQTGRVLRKIDSRTNLYALGVIFYEMLTGTRPFESDDYVDVIYCHLAREALPANQVNPQLSQVLSDIVVKLMQKKMENRYQTVAGLKADLEICRKVMSISNSDVTIPTFKLGRYDITQNLSFSKNVLGRKSELAQLLQGFEEAKKGQQQLMFVTGYSGVGKTTLVNELRLHIGDSRVQFIQGKFDQFKKSIPYHSFIQAFDQLFKEILSQSKEDILRWEERILCAVSGNGKVITDIFPKLEMIIGPQEPVESLAANEAQYRLQRVFNQFLQGITSNTVPLILFLDDLQWADIHSLKLLEIIAAEKARIPLFLIGAYRDNEVHPGHPLSALIEKIRRENPTQIEVLLLKPLNLLQVRQQVIQVLGRKDEQAELFARLCHVKTGGNPFFMNQFITTLKDEGLIIYSAEQENWEVSLDQILNRSVTDNVIDFMVEKIEKLPLKSIEVLKWASCINNTFDIKTLAQTQGLTEEEVLGVLNEGIKEGLIIYQEDTREDFSEAFIEYSFLHDRVQQAANSLLSESEKKEICYQLGIWFLNNKPNFKNAKNLLEITDYLNYAQDRMSSSQETKLLARLNLEAGKRAKQSLAYESALDYLQRGMALLGSQIWENNHDMALELYTEGTETAYLCGEYALVDEYGEEVIRQETLLLNKAAIYIIRIESYTVQNRLFDAIETAREILCLLGIQIPQKPTRYDILWKYLQIKAALWGRNFDDLKAMPEMRDKTYLVIMRILTCTGIAAYSSSPRILMMLTLNVVLISLKHGTAPATPVAYAGYGHFLCTYMKKRELGYQFGKLAIELQAPMKSKAFQCKNHLLFEILVRHQREPIRYTLGGFPRHHEMGLNEGDLTSAGHVMMQYFVYLYLAGRELTDIKKVMEDYKDVLLRTGNTTSIMVCLMYLQGHVNLLESKPEPWILTGEYFQELEALPLYKETNDRTIIFNSYFNKMILSYLSGNYREALANIKVVEEYIDGAIGTFCIPVYHFYSVLIRLEILDRCSFFERFTQQKKYRSSLKELCGFLKAAPENILNKYWLIRAELAKGRGKPEQTLGYYDKSIQAALDHGFLPEEALANELAARYAFSSGRMRLAENYVREAIRGYGAWGWGGKAKKLQANYREILQDKEVSLDRFECAAASELPDFRRLDMETIIRASQALSEEIVLQDLLKKLIWLVLQNAGARKAYLLLERDGDYYIEAQGDAESEAVALPQDVLVKSREQLPQKILNYVVNARETLVLNKEEEIQQFLGELLSYRKTAKSMLCMPVESKGNMLGILYLENDLMDGAFSGEHLLVLKILVSQSAISIENARLYQNLEKRVEERTAQLKAKNFELKTTNLQLEQANQAKTEFLAKMSHEMRTPLHGIFGMASLIQKGRLLPEQGEHLKSIIDSAQVLLEIINQILDSSKVEANRIELEEKTFDITFLLEELIPGFLVKAQEKGLQVKIESTPDTFSGLRGDPLRIKQILANLLSNAIKFTEKGLIQVRYSVIPQNPATHEEGAPATLEMSIEDSGIGIPQDKLDYIFEDFTQVDSSISRKYGGTGLGLAITKKLLDLMKGSITVESRLGQGSKFQCRIPLRLSGENWTVNKEGNSNPPSKNCQFQDLGKLKVLVAEDDAVSRKYVQALLHYLGCNAKMVLNGLEVLEELKAREYDCVIMDKNMPELDGIETTRRIRRNEALTGKHLPIIALTASALAGDREKLLAAGMDYFITKPIHEAHLIQLLEGIQQGDLPRMSAHQPQSLLMDRSVFLAEAELYGDEVVLDIVEKFLTDYEKMLILIEETIQKADFERIRKNAHRLASTLSIFHSSELVSLAQGLEQKALDHELEDLRTGFRELKAKIGVFVLELMGIEGVLKQRIASK
ncbi:putative ATPase [Desulfosporosinus orientis DSM 765]|uniref:Circadian input-output histidine kinase CikA n=1 Tax=Desulfosporosinus orientis (strain ATCC 19365 / DSM 765 / NCIMB 8382 / VKM B-1628 / Singapore I) TaxID=768706 RepID=G7W9M9_DESOD|nr:AAA family ATPase [Desulfosporosinus orientis]AET69946.1 putative ATPase [Desulfosporosinus orientis DSM 765]